MLAHVLHQLVAQVVSQLTTLGAADDALVGRKSELPTMVTASVQLNPLVERAVARGLKLVTHVADELRVLAGCLDSVRQLQYGVCHVSLQKTSNEQLS